MIDRIDHIVLNCTDVQATAAWYVQALGFERITYGPKQRVALRFGRHKFNLRPSGAENWLTSRNDAAGSLDLCFVTKGPIQAVIDRWGRLDIEIIFGPNTQDGAEGPMTSVYCRDPDGNLIEVSSYH